MSEQSTDDTTSGTPWLAIAVGVAVLGMVVIAGLGSVEPPPPPRGPHTIPHIQADLGDWEPFADLGPATDAAMPDAAMPDAAMPDAGAD